ncbi:MAG: hypothetical protein AAF799_16035 [Myxococcota bacterium]
MASLLAFSTLSGCSKLEELTGDKEDKKEETAKSDGDEAKAGDDKTKEGAGDSKKEGGGDEATPTPDGDAAPIVEPIPVEPLHTGLDLMLKFVPKGSDFMIARDATVVADYVAEGTRFLDGPLEKLKTGPFAEERDLKEAEDAFDEVKLHTDKVVAALEGSGIDLAEGAAIIKGKGGKDFLIFHASDPNALIELGKNTGEDEIAKLKCKAIEDVPGFNVCADSQSHVDGFKADGDPAALRKDMEENLPGVTLDDANLVASFEDDDKSKGQMYMAVSTIPGQIHMAVTSAGDRDLNEAMDKMQPGPAKTLAQVQPGAGFIWARVDPKELAKEAKDAKGTPAEGALKALTGEFVLAGSVDPGGLILQMGTSDTAVFEGLIGLGFTLGKDSVPPEIPDVPGAKLLFEQVPIEGGGKTAQALHLGVTGRPEADILKSYTGVHLDGWVFAANDVVTVAVGPDTANVGKLLDVTAGGPSSATLDTLPPQLAEGLRREEVGMVMHLPMDFLHGEQMHTLVRSALKDVPEASPEHVLALTSLAAPLSSTTMWIAAPGGKPVVHLAVQGIGNLATDEGRAALDAAHTVADGGNPKDAFSSLASTYASSPMAWAYKTRAGTEGPGYMVGSGIGAVLAAAAVAVPVITGHVNESLADDLGVKPEDPEPELKPTTVPKRPVVEPKKPEPTKDEPKKPEPTKDEPKKPEPTKDEPKKDDPIVEPTKPSRPLPPTPTPDPGKDEPKRKRKFGKRGG